MYLTTNFIIFISNIVRLINEKWEFFLRSQSWFDVAILGSNLAYAINIFSDSDINNMDREKFEDVTKQIRLHEVFTMILIWMKQTYMLSLIDSFAPIIDQIKSIFMGIRYFIIILSLFGFCFAVCMLLIGLNQVNFDNISALDMDLYGVEYSTFSGSLWFIYNGIILGNATTKSFFLGDAS